MSTDALAMRISSNSGFPEGCPLSILAMLNVNWCYHAYMKHFCPRVTSYSFVDNLTLAAREALDVIQAYFALRTICALFGLETDDGKTYVWALTKPARDCLAQLGFPCQTDACELGGGGYDIWSIPQNSTATPTWHQSSNQMEEAQAIASANSSEAVSSFQSFLAAGFSWGCKCFGC